MQDEPAKREVDEATAVLARSIHPQEQMQARAVLRTADDYLARMLDLYLANPALRLTEEESAAIQQKVRPTALGHLIAARDAAIRSPSPKHVVFCMPKSGSSFVKSALVHALRLPFVSLTGFGTPGANSLFGMNSREQE